MGIYIYFRVWFEGAYYFSIRLRGFNIETKSVKIAFFEWNERTWAPCGKKSPSFETLGGPHTWACQRGASHDRTWLQKASRWSTRASPTESRTTKGWARDTRTACAAKFADNFHYGTWQLSRRGLLLPLYFLLSFCSAAFSWLLTRYIS